MSNDVKLFGIEAEKDRMDPHNRGYDNPALSRRWLDITPTTTASYFGTKDYARNYGLVFTAYGAGAVIGNLIAGQMKDILGAYIRVFPVINFRVAQRTYFKIDGDC